ncbi:MAG: lysyl oxidase family protein [Lacipirellulaceae bacterium]
MLLSANGYAGSLTHLYPDIVPYVEEDAPAALQTLQAWSLTGTSLRYSTLYANQGDGLFEIRRGPVIDANRYQLLQRVYTGTDFGATYEDIPIGTAPIPGTAGSPLPSDTNVIWLEDFTRFSLHEAPVVGGFLTVGAEVAGVMKTSWRLSANRGPLPGFASAPNYASPDQRDQQRISVGWADLYGAGSSGQVFDITGVPVGPLYWLRQTVDPSNRIRETDETNNTAQVLIDLRNPGSAVRFSGQFLQPGDRTAPTPGDLTGDGLVNIDDWLAFKVGATSSVAGLDPRDAYALGDLDFDGAHSLSDAVLFRQHYDASNGAGAFAAIQSPVPEPTSLVLLGGAGALAVAVTRPRLRRAVSIVLAFAAFGLASKARVSSARVVLFSENFDGLPLRPNLNETLANPLAWTDTPPAGWVVNDSGVRTVGIPSRGVKEWEGWTFANKAWWSAAAIDQGRGQFSLGSGTVAVADPDEWEDRGAPVNGASGLPALGYYNAWMRTPSISLASAAPSSAKLSFASSWRDECCDDGTARTNNQTALVRASYNGGATFQEVLRWESNSTSPFFKDDATNERVTINLANPAGASGVLLEFGLVNAGNDWWWAIDDLQVFAPSTLSIDVATGDARILGGANLTGYQISSPSGALNPNGWRAANLDSQNFGSPLPTSADFNNDGVVNAADYTVWRDADRSAPDYAAWAAQYGRSVSAGGSWETLIASDNQLLEFFLDGQSSFTTASIGAAFDAGSTSRDLRFVYSDATGQEVEGVVAYVTGAPPRTVPEPSGVAVAALALVGSLATRRG